MATQIVAANTQWTSLKENPPPPYVYLLLRGKAVGFEDVSVIVLGYWSARANTFMNADDGLALMEVLDLEAYHIITDDDGMYIGVIAEIEA